mmetsp:Transcript_23689/g.35333  ORF Transcript_23689/g.35333 Transcript_23689/m.35333 type:complete len:88 (+) Transcript_23689:127-390(+)
MKGRDTKIKMHQNQTLKLEKMTRDQRKPTHVTSNKESRDHIKSILVAASGLLSLGDNSFDGITNKPCNCAFNTICRENFHEFFWKSQ